jgi:glycosyltransferase involved in cell wall biosynthesis
VRVLVVDPPYFTLPYDLDFCRALARAGAAVELIGRPLRAYEGVPVGEPVAMRPLFYRLSEGRGAGWKTSHATRILKGVEHAAGLVSLDRLVAMTRPDVVHFQWLILPLLDGPALRRLGRLATLVLTVHNSSLGAHGAAALVGGVGAGFQRLGRRGLIGLFDGFVAHTEQTRLHLERQGVPPDRIRVLDHPPLSLVQPSSAPAPALADGKVRILFFGSIKAYKGVDVLVRAGLDLLPANPDCRIDVVGRPFDALDDERRLVEAAGLQDRFGFDLRYVPEEDLAAYLAAADVVVFPYREIDASGAFALAVAAGKPIVASAVGVFAEPPAARHVCLIPPGDPDALAAALARLVCDADARDRLAAGSRTLRASLASWDSFAAGCLAFYRERGAVGQPAGAPSRRQR